MKSIAKHFRLGNWVNYNISSFNKDGQVDAITKNRISIDGVISKHMEYRPILLTELWLIRFGFTRCDCSQKIYFNKTSENYSINCENNKFELCIKKYYDDSEIHLFDLKFVHQLQNIYFDLIGIDLY
jgi:hypothetical protein